MSASQDSCRIWSIVSGGKCIHVLPSTAGDFASCTFHPAYSQVVAVGSYEVRKFDLHNKPVKDTIQELILFRELARNQYELIFSQDQLLSY